MTGFTAGNSCESFCVLLKAPFVSMSRTAAVLVASVISPGRCPRRTRGITCRCSRLHSNTLTGCCSRASRAGCRPRTSCSSIARSLHLSSEQARSGVCSISVALRGLRRRPLFCGARTIAADCAAQAARHRGAASGTLRPRPRLCRPAARMGQCRATSRDLASGCLSAPSPEETEVSTGSRPVTAYVAVPSAHGGPSAHSP